ncbi:hypothetical protein Slin15195_G049350 [Septoria linicola]|uniref:Uncharacterized protein n=1 Tax=Septoria linicola TaxID=215465 RepID=A0A9Q9EHA3_9PEZI|nr:hypothetical protein Slin15195_G049350 [Septoria linicola]
MYSRRLRDEHAAHKHEYEVPHQSQVSLVGYSAAILDEVICDSADDSQLENSKSYNSMELSGPVQHDVEEENWPFPQSCRPQEDSQTSCTDQRSCTSRPTSSIFSQPSRLESAKESRETATTPRRKLKEKPASVSRSPLTIDQQDPPRSPAEETASRECSVIDRRELRCLLSSPDYDYDSLAPINFSWRPIPYKRPGRQQETQTNTSTFNDDQDLGLDHDWVNNCDTSEDDSKTTFEFRPFWDINDNLTGRPEHATNTTSPADNNDTSTCDEPNESCKNSPRTPRAKNPCYAKKTRKALRSSSRARPLSPVDELSEPESDTSSSSEDEIDIEIGVAKRISVTSIELSPQKAWELRRMRSEAKTGGPRGLEADEKGFERVDSVVEREGALARGV